MMTLRHRRRIEKHRMKRKLKRLAQRKAQQGFHIRMRRYKDSLKNRPVVKIQPKQPEEKKKGFHPIALLKKVLSRRGA